MMIRNFLYAIKLVPPKDLGCREIKVSKCMKLSMHVYFGFSMLGGVLGLSGIDFKK